VTAPVSASGAGALTRASGAGGLTRASGAGGLGSASGASLAWPSTRTLAAAAAIALVLVGRGDLLFLGGLLALALAERRSSGAAVLAAAAVAVRWGTTSADTVTGVVTTLGPAVRVGPPHAAAALALAAGALLLAGLKAPLLPRLAAGVAAGAVVAGPLGTASSGAVVVGLLGVTAGGAAAVVLPRFVPEPTARMRRAAPVAGALALALAAVW
jgi:hypothetical protein